jgi:CheY-like chemotaxis protein
MAVILVVDDLKKLRSVIAAILQSVGHQVVTAADSNEALKILGERPVDLLVTDILMPEKDGAELIAELRDRGDQRPIIAVSAGGEGVTRSEALFMPKKFADLVLEKPFSRDALINAINSLLDKPTS